MPDKKRIPRGEAAYAAGLLAFQMPVDIRWHMGGSWRRGAAWIGDLDVLVVTESGTFAEFPFPACFTPERGGDRIVNGHVTALNGLVMHADFWACTPAQAGAFLCFITGPADLNIRQRDAAKRRGLKLSQDGLFDGSGQLIPCATEEEVYARLGFTWIPPEERGGTTPSVPDGTWEVPSSSGGDPCTVTCRNGYWSGTCKGFRYRRGCRHVNEVREGVMSGVIEPAGAGG
jgi:DNA polymerase/3'-5' exonuclease PolX